MGTTKIEGGGFAISFVTIRLSRHRNLSRTKCTPLDRKFNSKGYLVNVRYWHKADIGSRGLNVCFGGKAGIIRTYFSQANMKSGRMLPVVVYSTRES